MCRISNRILWTLLAMMLVTLPAAAEPRTFKDALQQEITIEYPPKRLVSLSPGVTEMLFAIGLDKQIVGVTRYCNYPPKARRRVKVGGYYDPSLEKIVALEPDLVIMAADGYNKPAADKLTEMGLACFVVNPRSVPGIIRTMELLARITGIETLAVPRITKLKDRWVAVENVVKMIPRERRVRVFYGLDARDLWTTGDKTFLNDLIQRAGGVNIAAEEREGWYQFSMEKLVLVNPDYILTGRSANQKRKAVLEEWAIRKSIPAVAAGRILTVDNDSLSRPGPRSIDVLEQLLLQFYNIDLQPPISSEHP